MEIGSKTYDGRVVSHKVVQALIPVVGYISNSHYREVFVQYLRALIEAYRVAYAALKTSCQLLYIQNSYMASSKASSVYIKMLNGR